jgi:hypothetical protein
MNELQKAFRDKLLDVEEPSADYKAKYEKEMLAMVEKKLTGLRKFGCIVGLAMGLGFAGLFGTFAVIAPKGFPLWGRSIWVLGAVFGLLIVVMEVWILKKGTINLKDDEMAMAGLSWAFIVIAGCIVLVFSGGSPDPLISIRMLVSLLFFLVMAALFMIRAFVQRSELNTREKLLEIEYRLAELVEKIENKNSE